MDPNNNQPTGTSPSQQPVSAPVGTPPVQPVTPPSSQNVGENPKKGFEKGIMLLIILLLLGTGIVIYIMFAKNQIGNSQKMSSNNNSVIIPSPTLAPPLAPEADLEITSPEADLSDLETDARGL